MYLDKLMVISKITDNSMVNLSLVGITAFLSQVFHFLEGFVPVLLGIISCCVGVAFIIVHIKTIKLKNMEIAKRERELEREVE